MAASALDRLNIPKDSITKKGRIMAPSALDHLNILKAADPVKIELSAKDSNGQLAELLNYIRHNGNGGHSFVIIVDPDLKENTKRFSWDGDGGNRIDEIKVNGDVLKVKDAEGHEHASDGKFTSGSGGPGKNPSSLLENFSLGPSKPRSERGSPKLVEFKLGRLDNKSSTAISEHVNKIVDSSPDLKKVAIDVKVSDLREHLSQKESEHAYAIHEHGHIALNEKFFGNNEKFIKDLKKQEASGFHPKGCGTPDAVVSHEMGHVLFERLDELGDGRADEIDDLIRDAAKSGELAKVSRYATYGIDEDDLREAKAEIYSSIHHTPAQDQQPLVRKVARILNGAAA